jgi:RNA polymerase sigma factor (sigma-70 family)
MEREPNLGELKHLLTSCCEDKLRAKQEFQSRYGKAIYNFPVKVFRIKEERAGDFYLYAFENNRIFKRLRHFRGETITFESYLKHFVLRDLALEWLRKESNTSIQMSALVYEPSTDDGNREPCCEEQSNIFELLRKKECLVLHIFYLYELPLSPDDIRLVCRNSGKSIAETIKNIAKIEKHLFERAQKQTEKAQKLDILFSRRMEYQRRLLSIEESINLARQNHDRTKLEALKKEKEVLIQKYAWRLKQAGTILEQGPNSLVTTPYKDIAQLLGTSTGAVSSMIHKAKNRIKKQLARIAGINSTRGRTS